jgi:DNA-binding NtrC family response regulator
LPFQPRFLLIHESLECRASLLRSLRTETHLQVEACDYDAAVPECRNNVIDLVLLHLPDSQPEPPFDLLRALGRLAPVFFLRGNGQDEVLNAALNQMQRYSQFRREANPVRANEPQPLLGETEAMRKLRLYISRVARSDCNVLVTGETGTGKELVAHMIHHESLRRGKPFICLNCAAVPDALFESELFGHERGAFTGASCSRDGRMRQADGGTLFLDEIGELTPLVQAKLLRAIETKELQRIGARNTTAVDIRIVAATNQDLQSLVTAGLFRKDLYFRLNVARVSLPPLRARREDIPIFLEAHLAYLNRHYGTRVSGFSDAALQVLLSHDWPGNVRELKNALEATMVNVQGEWIQSEDLPEGLRPSDEQPEQDPDRQRLLDALQICHWNKAEAARQLQWSRMTLYRKMARYQIADQPPARRKAVRTTSVMDARGLLSGVS